jgi:hypothetical protein
VGTGSPIASISSKGRPFIIRADPLPGFLRCRRVVEVGVGDHVEGRLIAQSTTKMGCRRGLSSILYQPVVVLVGAAAFAGSNMPRLKELQKL